MDGSTDKGNVDDKIFLVTYCDVDGCDEKVHTRMDFLLGCDEKVHTRMDFLCVRRPQAVTGIGLLNRKLYTVD